MHEELKKELREATEKILASTHPKKLVVAGPGAGKTFLFKGLLERSVGASPEAEHLVVSFINGLVDDLSKSLGHLRESVHLP